MNKNLNAPHLKFRVLFGITSVRRQHFYTSCVCTVVDHSLCVCVSFVVMVTRAIPVVGNIVQCTSLQTTVSYNLLHLCNTRTYIMISLVLWFNMLIFIMNIFRGFGGRLHFSFGDYGGLVYDLNCLVYRVLVIPITDFNL